MAHEDTHTHDSHAHDGHGHEYVADPVEKAAAYRMILMVALALGALTLLEAGAALVTTSAIIMFIIAFIKAGLVVNFFMHIYRLWREDAH